MGGCWAEYSVAELVGRWALRAASLKAYLLAAPMEY